MLLYLNWTEKRTSNPMVEDSNSSRSTFENKIKRRIKYKNLNNTFEYGKVDIIKLSEINFSEKDIKRFWSYVEISKDCWNWIGAIANSGYGVLSVGGKKGKTFLCHRISYCLYYGKFDESLLVCHTCDNRSCVNPNHFFLGTDEDNLKDMYQKGRHGMLGKKMREEVIKKVQLSRKGKYQGEKACNVKLKEKDVMKIRKLLLDGNYTEREIGDMFGVSLYTISDIKRGKSWKGLGIDKD